ncbi:hypothetical protein Mpsy_2604 [Methanolobus psychrophilus R15]|nr:hypothetical protein Mpsy_2604 [Methanolobus psychrophilus R15]
MQQVHINRLGVNSIEFDTGTVELPLSPGEERSFELVMINYGAPTHVNLSVSDSLRENITMLEDNPYVRHEEYVPIIARIPYGGRLYTRGQVFVTVGYGSRKAGFEFNVGQPGPDDANFTVDVDTSLSTPRKSSSHGRKDHGENWSSQLPEISLQMVRSVFEMASSRSVYMVAAFVFLMSVMIMAMILLSVDFGPFFGFYPSVFYSILLTFLMAFLMIRLPIFK